MARSGSRRGSLILDSNVTLEECQNRRGSLIRFEENNHKALLDWITKQVPHSGGPGISILDFSEDGGVFTSLLTHTLRESGISVDTATVAFRDVEGVSADENEVDFKFFDMGWIRRKEFKELAAFGQYDLIICKEMLYEVHEHYASFFEALKDYNLKPNGHLVIIALAKEHGPVPLPTKAVNQWRHLVASKQEIYEALVEAGYDQTIFGATVEVHVPKSDWKNILKSGSIDVVKFASGCDVYAIDKFVDMKPGKIFDFEEKLLVIFAWDKKINELKAN